MSKIQWSGWKKYNSPYQPQCVDRPLRWAIHTVKPLDSFVNGNVAILGDAVRIWFIIPDERLGLIRSRNVGTCTYSSSRIRSRSSNRSKPIISLSPRWSPTKIPLTLQDAYILSTVLGHRLTSRETTIQALRIYDHIRRPFSQKAQERARLNGQYFTFSCRELDFDSIPEPELIPKLKALGQIFTKNWEWAWTTSMGPSVGEAMRLLESSWGVLINLL